MSTPGEAIGEAVRRHRASIDAVTALAAEIERERQDQGSPPTGQDESAVLSAPVPPPGG